LLFADENGVVSKLAEQMRALGNRCTLVSRGRYDFDLELSHLELTASADYQRLLADLRAAGRAVQGIIYGWALDAVSWDGMTEQQLVDSWARGATSPMLLAKSLVGESLPPRLWVLTRGAQISGGMGRYQNPRPGTP
jgi:hypothetical protein